MKQDRESYQYDTWKDRETELQRLRRQATLLTKKELDALHRFGLRDGMSVLDAACGPGQFSATLSSVLPNSKIVGIDINETLLEEAKRMVEAGDTKLLFEQADVYDLPFCEEFDFIYCRLLFQHLSNPQKALQSLNKALRPNGILCIMDIDDEWLAIEPAVPSFEYLRERSCEYQAFLGGDRRVGKKLRNYLKHAGFAHLQVDLLPTNTDEIGMELFIDIIATFRVEQARNLGVQDADKYLQQLRDTARENDLFGIVAPFVVAGRKEWESTERG
ncbi:MAG: methyltransferase domain-containing protein [Clostridia bacterium]